MIVAVILRIDFLFLFVENIIGISCSSYKLFYKVSDYLGKVSVFGLEFDFAHVATCCHCPAVLETVFYCRAYCVNALENGICIHSNRS